MKQTIKKTAKQVLQFLAATAFISCAAVAVQASSKDAKDGKNAIDGHHQQHEHATEDAHDQHDHAGEHSYKHDEAAHEESAHDENSHDEHGMSGHGDNDSEHKEDGHEEDGHDEDEHEEDGHEEDEHEEDEHEGHDGHAGEESEGVALSSAQQSLANIKVSALARQVLATRVYAPGEIKVNGYTSYMVSPRVDSVVLRRHVALGDHVERGQVLVTLFSETVAAAQADYLVAVSEWQRVKSLGRTAVGAKRFIRTETNFDAAYSRLLAFGLSEPSIARLSRKKGSEGAAHRLGEYSLIASTNGAVLSDDFHQGQRVEAGTALMALADERELWVEARLSPHSKLSFSKGDEVSVRVGEDWFVARVAQKSHTIDPITRTRIVRLLLDNSAHRLHAGMFADVYFEILIKKPVLAVPETALMRSADGDWTVFVEVEKGQFKGQEVALGRSLVRGSTQWREVKGIAVGTLVVTEGAFFVASQIAKGGFDPHNH